MRTFRNMWKTFCLKIFKKCYEQFGILLAVRKHFLFLCEVVTAKFWCYIQAMVTSKNRHHGICGWTHGAEKNFSEIVAIKEINTWKLAMAVSDIDVHQINFLQHQIYLSPPGDGPVPSPRGGDFGGFPPKQSSNPPKLKHDAL